MKLPRAVCPDCGQEMGVRVPAGGDGSADVFPRHMDHKARRRCDGSRMEVRPR